MGLRRALVASSGLAGSVSALSLGSVFWNPTQGSSLGFGFCFQLGRIEARRRLLSWEAVVSREPVTP